MEETKTLFFSGRDREHSWVQDPIPIQGRREETLSHPKPSTNIRESLANTGSGEVMLLRKTDP